VGGGKKKKNRGILFPKGERHRLRQDPTRARGNRDESGKGGEKPTKEVYHGGAERRKKEPGKNLDNNQREDFPGLSEGEGKI